MSAVVSFLQLGVSSHLGRLRGLDKFGQFGNSPTSSQTPPARTSKEPGILRPNARQGQDSDNRVRQLLKLPVSRSNHKVDSTLG